MKIERAPNPWISPGRAAKRLGVSEMSIYKWALLGRIRVLIEPGQNVKLSREDVEKVAAERAESDPVPAPA